MDLKSYFIDKFNYNLVANQRTTGSLELAGSYPEKAYILLSHILVAHSIWLLRISDPELSKTINPWAAMARESFIKVNEQLFADTVSMLETEDLSRYISYVNSKGESFQNSIGDICSHILMHSTYHRGQIAQLLSAEGHKPAVTDYIFYKRQ